MMSPRRAKTRIFISGSHKWKLYTSVRCCDNPPHGFAGGSLLQDDVVARSGLMTWASAGNDGKSGAWVTFYWARPEAEDWFLSVRRAIETGCEKNRQTVRGLLIELEVEPQEQINHAIRGLVVKEFSGK